MNSDIKRLWKGFWQISDVKLWAASAAPIFCAFALALHSRQNEPLYITLFWFALSAAAVFAVETGKNAINELVDFEIDSAVAPQDLTPFNAGKKTLTSGLLSKKECLIIAVLSYAFCAGAGVLIIFFRSFAALYAGLLGAALSVFYSLPHVKLCYRGWGEATVGITYGPVLMAGISLVVSGKILSEVMAASVILGFFIANVLWINEYPDYEADMAGGKRTGVVRLGKKNALIVYGALFLMGYLAAVFMALYFKRVEFLLPLITAGMAYRAVKNARENYDFTPKLISSNALTVKIYLVTGAAIIAAAVIKNFY